MPKLKVHAICPRCGQRAAYRDGDMIRGWHDCPNAPPGPVDPPMFFRTSDVEFIDNSAEPH